MKIVIAVLILTLAATAPTAAQTDWDTDNYGVFFDTAGTRTALTTTPGLVTAWLLLLNPTAPAGETAGWEAGCWSVREIGDHNFPVGSGLPLTFTAAWGGIIVPGDCGDGLWAGGGPGTVPDTGAIVLGTFEVIVATTSPYGFYDNMGGGSMAVDGVGEIPLQTSTYPLSTMPPLLWLAATINSDHVPVPDEDLGWGAVKALYR